MSDLGFPVIKYEHNKSPREWGQMHGETWRTGITELIKIRTLLMREKNPGLTPPIIVDLAAQQWAANMAYDANLTEELAGIAEGAGVTTSDITVLNNYTDFRDIVVPDQGCSVVFVNYDQNPVAGQTWDMHASAKRYVCCMSVPCDGYDTPMILFSLVGCLGMMGYHPSGQMIGVNNINTDGARPGAMWPAVVRKSLARPGHAAIVNELTTAPVTSGHTYLVASRQVGEFWEIMPGLADRVGSMSVDQNGYLFHTNHCLGSRARKRETVLAQNTTTYIRYELLEKKIGLVRDFDGVYDLLNDHENYPKSICSNFQSNPQDPSVTCGGAVGDLNSGRIKMWRGDAQYDDNFVCHEFQMGDPVQNKNRSSIQ